MVKNIVFDMGGVLVEFSPQKVLDRFFTKEESKFITENVFNTTMWRERDRGTLQSEQLLLNVRHLFSEEVYCKLRKFVLNFFAYMPEFDDVCETIKMLKEQGYGLYVLSNCSPDFYQNGQYIKSIRYFDGLLLSCDCGFLKPEPEIYEHLFNKFGLNAGECIFFDDLQENVDGAIAMGMQAFRFNHDDMQSFNAELRRVGVKI
ncbi:MAG: HAD family phosphatase [Clostridiales bacterium]|nr:HAD family phosphatase [Clostridiales bacterium]